MTAYEREMKRIQDRLDAMTNEERAAFIARDLATQREAVDNGDMTQEEYEAYAARYDGYNTPTVTTPSQPPSAPSVPPSAPSAPTSAPSAVDTSYATNLTGGKSQQQIEAEKRVEENYAKRAETDPEWVEQREQRDLVTQWEAVQNGDMTEEDYLAYASQYNSKDTPDDQKVGLEVPVDTSYGANTAPQTDAAAKAEADRLAAEAAAKAEADRLAAEAAAKAAAEKAAADKLAAEQKKKEEEEALLSYQQYIQGIKDNMTAQNSIYTAQTEYWDRQTEEALKALAAQKEAADSYAANFRDDAKNAAASQKESIYKAAEETKKNTYASAKEQQEMTYAEAEKERERASVDAGTSYAQNLAGYGANAEKLAAMGLTTSGASDYANAKAYAQQRAEIQGANAKARDEMRYADYEKRQTELGADRDYANAINNADIDFAKANSAADLTYAQNMYEAASGYAKDALGIRKTGEQGKMEAAITYMNNLGNSDMEKSQKKDTLLQMAASGEASEELIRQLAKNNGFSEAEIEQMAAMAKTAIDTKTNEAKTNQIAALMEAAANGADSQTIAMLGKLYGLDTEQVKQVTDTIEAKEKEAADAAEQVEIDSLGDDYTAADVDNLEISDEKKAKLKQAAYDKVLSQAQAAIKANGGQLGDLTDVDEAFQSGNLDEKTYKQIYRENATALATNAKTAEDIAAVEQQLETYATQGKITTAERKAAIDQLYKSAVQSVKNDGKVTFDGLKTGTVNFNGNEYLVKIANTADEQTRTILDKIHSGAKDGDMARVDGKIYMIRNGKWHLVTDAYSNGFYQAYERYYGDRGNRETTGGGNNLTGGGVSSEVTQTNK